MPGASGRAERSDAERNRSRILDVAATALAESAATTLHSIAKRAGVGQGTFYRHFPNRDALLLALHEHDVQALLAAAPGLLATHPPLEALRRWLDQLDRCARAEHGLSRAVEAATRADLAPEHHDRVHAAVTALLDAGRATGELRSDVDADDLLLLCGFLWHRSGGTRADHLLDVVLTGLRPTR
ncbi:TetR/AcrR family transcriptional regulator [Saccharopolyspora sp. MS10]|uniref:TetR/AcrR family transcriptional regulator n=1 Tax=Saccharopolyspora sp. MS10 TaxID=3385973 RepID=UPI00399F204D